ncbi:unnamed protein product [Dicrocoelium dendriticum]|nr:unnamed protein product [Dicrocoelium dendriticum]
MLSQRRPLLWVCLLFVSGGLLCNLIAFILPYWFARFPNSKNRFLRLGLWEICLQEYMPHDLGNFMYTGCFYLFDPQIHALRPNFMRTWFLVCQIFYTLCFISYVVVTVVLLSQAVNLVSPRGPRAVLFGIVTSGLTCILLLVTLTVMGAGVDSESKRKPAAQQDWLQSLDQCSLSWSYGLAACSMPGSLLTFAILSCFVYPKRSSHGLLSVNAWNWPSLADWTCQHNRSNSYHSTSRSCSYQSRSFASRDVRTHSSLNERAAPRFTLAFRDPLISATPSDSSGRRRMHTPASPHRTPIPQYAPHRVFQTDERVSSYDPRSPDSISLLSYEPQLTRNNDRYSRNTSDGGPNRALDSVNSYRAKAKSNRDSQRSLSDPLRSSSATSSSKPPPGSSVEIQRTGAGSSSGLRSADTSVWTANSPTENTGPPARVQAAKKMKRKS